MHCLRMASGPGPRARERGFVLPFAMIIMMLALVMELAYLEMNRMDAVGAVRDVARIQAASAAEVGLARAQAMALNQNISWVVMKYNGAAITSYFAPNANYSGHYVCTLPALTNVAVGGTLTGTYSVVIEDLDGFTPTDGHFRIHAYGTVGGATRHITADAQILTYAAFGWLTDNENGVYFGTGDTIDGWVYSNDQLNIWGTPVFKGRANSAASSLHYGHGGPPTDQADFQKGLTLNSLPLDITSLVNNGQITVIQTAANTADSNGKMGIALASNSGRPYSVEFLAGGKVTIQKLGSDSKWTTVVDQKLLSDTNGAIYIEENVQVSGVVDGNVTLATSASKDITIVDDLVYASPATPATAFQSNFDMTAVSFNDKLGLIAGRDIVIDTNWTDSSTSVYVMGSMLAVGGSFRNADYQSFPRKTLHLLGGVAQNTRGSVGTTGGTGFLKDYKYDARFVTAPPKYSPPLTYDFNAWTID